MTAAPDVSELLALNCRRMLHPTARPAKDDSELLAIDCGRMLPQVAGRRGASMSPSP